MLKFHLLAPPINHLKKLHTPTHTTGLSVQFTDLQSELENVLPTFRAIGMPVYYVAEKTLFGKILIRKRLKTKLAQCIHEWELRTGSVQSIKILSQPFWGPNHFRYNSFFLFSLLCNGQQL